MDSFNVISSTLTNQSSAPESPLGMLYFCFAWPPTRELRLLWLESAPDSDVPLDDVSSLSATSRKSHISWCYILDTL